MAAILVGCACRLSFAQEAGNVDLLQRIQELTDAVTRTQAQLEQSQRELMEMRKQLLELEREVAEKAPGGGAETSRAPATAAGAGTEAAQNPQSGTVEELRERQQIMESEIAVHDQTKVESESRYPVKITGMLLFTGFVNTSAVDVPATPTLAMPGGGSTGASIRQSILGFDARGPHLFGAGSYADLRVDFDGNPAASNVTSSSSGYAAGSATLLRLRTAHAGLQWDHSEAYFALDRPIFNPDTPTSLTAVAEPALAWSGNLWTWNPQLGYRQELEAKGPLAVQLEAALVDAADAPLTAQSAYWAIPPTSAEQSRWPGVEARLALLGSGRGEQRSHAGLGGYFAPHRSTSGFGFDSWAATADARMFLPARLEISGSGYRGAALGGLGGGAYKDFSYWAGMEPGEHYLRALDDAGGWAQIKERFSERLEANGAFGIDNAFAGELRNSVAYGGSTIQNLARNRTITGNVIYSPSAYLLFSVEYRRLRSFPLLAAPAESNVIGIGAGYKF